MALIMNSTQTLKPRVLAVIFTALPLVFSSCEKKRVAQAVEEDLDPLIHIVEAAADEFDHRLTQAKLAHVAAELQALSTQSTLTNPTSSKAEREDTMAETSRLKLDELSSALEEKLRATPESDKATSYYRRKEIRRKIEALTADLAVRKDRDRIMDELREARLELDALRPQMGKTQTEAPSS
ncbi:MAG: hypothetical protein EOP83_13605 [Verrucomicrobiaceae bacterium]|nr:MAG: hypothetical protein EOP83_13605 [Verrucomicrobiaceae bacterium]